MKTKRLIWTIVFLGVTLAAIVMEVVAGIFHPAGTIPWTEYLARYVPWPVQLIAYVTLAVWLPFHFWRHDHLRKVAYRDGHDDGYYQAIKDHNIKVPQGLDLLPEISVQRGGLHYRQREHVGPTCSHGFVFGSPESHHCGELPSDALLLPHEKI